jgi:P27 family predicted phage terminase small subunit
MPRGRPKPVEQHLREGTWRGDRHPQPVLVAGRPELEELREPPAHLTTAAKTFWSEIVVRLIEVGMIDRVDRPALEMLASSYGNWHEARKIRSQLGAFDKGSTGQTRIAPWVRLEEQALEHFMKLAEHFAIGPLSRTRLGLAELHRRTLAVELEEALGEPEFVPVEPEPDES